MKIGQKVVVNRPSANWNKGIEGVVVRIKPATRDLVIRVTKKSPWGNGSIGQEFGVAEHKCDIAGGFGHWIKEMEGNGNVKF